MKIKQLDNNKKYKSGEEKMERVTVGTKSGGKRMVPLYFVEKVQSYFFSNISVNFFLLKMMLVHGRKDI